MNATEHKTIHETLSELYSAAEQMRESAVAKWAKYSKNDRFKRAASYWEGMSQASACHRTIIGAHMRAQKCWPPIGYQTARDAIHDMVREPVNDRVNFDESAVKL